MLKINNIIEITVDADGFIIPNPLKKLNDLCSDTVNKITRVGRLFNDIDVNDDTTCAEIRFYSDDLHSGNISDDGFILSPEDGMENGCKLCVAPDEIPSYLPVELFNEKVEGDIVGWTYMCMGYLQQETGYMSEVPLLLHINIKLNQIGHFYKRFGKFEECLQTLINNAG